jgi:hypothetical protein
MSVNEKLLAVQVELKAPKNAYNSFGKYNYRSCEDILESVKPILAKNKATLTVCDDIVQIGERYYVKAKARFVDIETGDSVENVAFARESDDKKGMDASQVTGATSSYARKYALNGLFLIDDTKDVDTEEYQSQQKQVKKAPKAETKTDEQKNAEMVANTDKTMIPANGAITAEHKEKIKAEMVRTGINEKVILSLFKAKTVDELTDTQAVAVLNKFAKTPNAKKVD